MSLTFQALNEKIAEPLERRFYCRFCLCGRVYYRANESIAILVIYRHLFESSLHNDARVPLVQARPVPQRRQFSVSLCFLNKNCDVNEVRHF